MRHLTVLALAALAFLVAAGCRERSNMREMPDRQGHAYRTAAAERPIPAGPKMPYEDEQTYSAVKGDNLKTIAKKFMVTESWLIRRNDLQTNAIEVGQTVIVPKPATASGK